LNGTILQSTNNGSNWTPFSTGTTETFLGSSLSSVNSGFAVGTNGEIQIYNGTGWTAQSSGTTEQLNNVYALSNGTAFAAGDNQTILAYNGSSWSAQVCPLPMDVKDIRFTTTNLGYAVGTGGIVLQTTNGGANWTPSLTGVDIDFNTIEAIGPDSAWASGSHGIVYTTVDAGANWIRWSVGYTDDQTSLRVTAGKGHVVGHGGNGRNFAPTFGTGMPGIASPADFLHVFPNPAQNSFMISGNLDHTERLVIDIKDVQGRLIQKVLNTDTFGEFDLKVNTDSYPDGVYFVHVLKGQRSWVQKIVIAR
jgi:hypothetical protein